MNNTPQRFIVCDFCNQETNTQVKEINSIMATGQFNVCKSCYENVHEPYEPLIRKGA
jgi:ribosome-binding protein aMBF1 (putative translation factor)